MNNFCQLFSHYFNFLDFYQNIENFELYNLYFNNNFSLSDIDNKSIIFIKSGSYNNVFEAKLKNMNKNIIIRISKHETDQKILENEKMITIKMNKLNICPKIYNIYVDTKLCIIMEKYDTNLFYFIRRIYINNPITRDMILNNIINLVSKVSNQNLILLDLKPSNIVINTEQFKLKLIDFDPSFIINYAIINTINNNIKEIYKLIMLILLANHLYLLNNNIMSDYLSNHINNKNHQNIILVLKYLIYKKLHIFNLFFGNNYYNTQLNNVLINKMIRTLLYRACTFY